MASLLTLPDEVILHIFSYLSSRIQIVLVTRVCRRFLGLLGSQWYWRGQYVRLTRSQPIMEQVTKVAWQEGCMQREFALAAAGGRTSQCTLKGGGRGEIDCVHILHSEMCGARNVVAAGSRDTNVYIWKQRPVGVASSGRSMRDYTVATLSGHVGWVWSLASERDHRPNLLCSGSWDHNVMLWDVNTGECLEIIRDCHKAAVLSLHIPQRDCLISGCQDKRVRILDLRTPISVQAEHRVHKRSVLSVVASENYIYSGSEDKQVCVWDTRNRRTLQKLTFSGIVPSMCLDSNIVSLATTTEVRISGGDGEVEGEVEVEWVPEVFLYDSTRGDLDKITSFCTGHTRPVTSVFHCLGMVATGAKDGTVKLFDQGTSHNLLTLLDKQNKAITDLDFSKNCLAVAKGNVGLWTLSAS